MRRLVSIALWLSLASVGLAADETDLSLWYTEPARDWSEALPIGNGRMGAMVFGGAPEARYQFNEDTLWVGKPHDYAHAGAKDHLPEIRQLLLAGQQREAEQLAMQHFMSVPLGQAAYQPFGDVTIEFPQHDKYEQYRRDLNLDTAIATTSYVVDGVKYTREAFASYPDKAIVLRIEASQPGALTCTAKLTSPHQDSETTTIDATTLALKGKPGRVEHHFSAFDGFMMFEARLRVVTEGGACSTTNGVIEVRGADAATFLLVPATSFNSYRDISADPGARAQQGLDAIVDKPYQQLRQTHVQDHQKLFRRVSLQPWRNRRRGAADDRTHFELREPR